MCQSLTHEQSGALFSAIVINTALIDGSIEIPESITDTQVIDF